MLMSESDEIALDQENAPHQFSSDYGATLDSSLNAYITEVGAALASWSHRPNMPYSFRGVNATYVNAYAFPGGSIAATRGILLELHNEAELAGLLGHEIGHVSARHTASRMTTGLLVQGAVALVAIGMESSEKYKDWAPLAAGLGGIAGGVLLAHYSRDDERQADDLGMLYMTSAGYDPQGMVGLMDVLRSMSEGKPNAIDMMFATHPMSEERYETAKQSAAGKYAATQGDLLNEERYMDATAGLRKIKNAIDQMQDGEEAMMSEEYSKAEQSFNGALKQVPNDYAGLLMMSKCQLALERPDRAKQYAERAQRVYPDEPQAYHVSGFASIQKGDFGSAYEEFDRYEQMLPGNPNTIFFKGFAAEGMGEQQAAADEYTRFLEAVTEGEQAEHAYQRLVEWGYVKP
jgi:beta-barrel assembly-enhancing protease